MPRRELVPVVSGSFGAHPSPGGEDGAGRQPRWRGHFLRRADRSCGWRRLLSAYRQGYLPQSLELYPLTEATRHAYLTDRDRVVTLSRVNGPGAAALHDRWVFHQVLAAFQEHLPRLLGVLYRGEFRPEPASGLATLADVLDRQVESRHEAGLVIEPVGRSDRRDVQILQPLAGSGGDVWEVNGRPVSRRDLAEHLAAARAHDGKVVSERVRAASYARDLYPYTTNTVRALMLRDATSRQPSLVAAVQRVGVSVSRPTDEFTAGGLSAPIDLRTGELGSALQKLRAEPLVRHEAHPETGVMIRGSQVPGWQGLEAGLGAMMSHLPFLVYVGWDVVVTEDGFKVIGADAQPEIDLLQVHAPLLAEASMRLFCEARGVQLGRPAGAGAA
ncbi:MAG TPA: sugar-transfer associated ATP-grasp domain-containing protein [Thermoanaerobaculia bacterium]|nr:sugar-transfer associated ATP-grasp domain-containing protein [Thermoanaerobaculia bacterium]